MLTTELLLLLLLLLQLLLPHNPTVRLFRVSRPRPNVLVSLFAVFLSYPLESLVPALLGLDGMARVAVHGRTVDPKAGIVLLLLLLLFGQVGGWSGLTL